MLCLLKSEIKVNSPNLESFYMDMKKIKRFALLLIMASLAVNVQAQLEQAVKKIFAIFMGYTFAIAFPKSSAAPEPAAPEHTAPEEEIKLLSWWKSILYIIGGLAALIYGGQLFVNGATGIARSMGVSESIIGLTLVAGGTSLPELATSIVAALKKNPEMAIGNVIGSNLFNIFFVLGCSASITPLHLSGITNFDLFTLVGSSILLWLFGLFFAKRTITRIEGSIMILCYVAYTVVLIYNS